MAWWVYKCNSKGHPYQNAWGDWKDFFDDDSRQDWGSTQWVPALEKLEKGDTIIAYQTDRNELAGIVQVRQSCDNDTFLYLDAIEVIGVKVRPLKSDPKIAAIPAFKPGRIQTVYEISEADAIQLLKAADSTFIKQDVSQKNRMGAGFGDTEKNIKVEKAAIAYIGQQYQKQGWSVQSVEQQRRGFDLLCRKGKKEEHIEVKGVSGNICSFIITANEVKQAKNDPKFILWAVTEVLSKSPKPYRFTGKELLKQFVLEPLQYKATLTSPPKTAG